MLFGFIGVGQMGGGLARNLIRAQKTVLVYDLNPEAVKQSLTAGTTGRAAANLDELAAADVVFTSLPLPQHEIEPHLYRTLYRKAAGGQFRNVAHLKTQIGIISGRM